MAKVANPRKVFQFALDAQGINQYLVQKITPPEVEIESVEHGDTNYDVKTAGKVKTGDMVLEKLKPAEGPDLWAHNWFKQAQDVLLGGGALSQVYKKDLTIRELDPSGKVTLQTHIIEGAWVKKISLNDRDRGASDNSIETVTLSVDRYYVI